MTFTEGAELHKGASEKEGQSPFEKIRSFSPKEQEQYARQHFHQLLDTARQPQEVSGKACIELCRFLEQCRKSKEHSLQVFVFSSGTCEEVFQFYLQWAEKNQPRQMRQVIEVVASLIVYNPDELSRKSLKAYILQQVFAIIARKSVQPFAKPALRGLDSLLVKGAVSLSDICQEHDKHHIAGSVSVSGKYEKPIKQSLLDSFISDVFEWMSFSDTSTQAGKLLTTIFKGLEKISLDLEDYQDNEYDGPIWYRWIQQGVQRHPGCVDNMKSHLFPYLFKLDRTGSIQFLQILVDQDINTILDENDPYSNASLLISALEVGKKLGLVVEQEHSWTQNGAGKNTSSVPFPFQIVAELLSHRSSTIRSSAFGALVHSYSSLRPFPTETLAMFQEHLGTLYADTDAKFRNEVMSNTKRMIERIRGIMTALVRELRKNSQNFVIDEGSSGNGERQLAKSAPLAPAAVLVSSQSTLVLKTHIGFLQWYLDFLVNELLPTASYQRHICSLTALLALLRSGCLNSASVDNSASSNGQSPWPFVLTPFSKTSVRLLLDLLYNPFEDVRHTASHILTFVPVGTSDSSTNVPVITGQKFFRPGSKVNSAEDILELILSEVSQSGHPLQSLETFKMNEVFASLTITGGDAANRTGRADLADGVALTNYLSMTGQNNPPGKVKFLEFLILNLEQGLLLAETNIGRAIQLRPLHPSFMSLKHIWEQVDEIFSLNEAPVDFKIDLPSFLARCQERILNACKRTWAIVAPTLCADAPEGFFPSSVDDIEEKTHQDILSFCFRAAHESSKLLHTLLIIHKRRVQDGSVHVTSGFLMEAGRLSLEQLVTLRHRGAFSTVTTTFSACCSLIQELNIKTDIAPGVFRGWYEVARSQINEQISTTRRSAGIPAIITGILSARGEDPSFAEVFNDLTEIASRPGPERSVQDETHVPQVHAINCLKEIFNSSNLAERSQSYIISGFHLAVENLQSKTWAIRNSSLLLLRSLTDRLLNPSDVKFQDSDDTWDGKSTRLQYDMYPTLPALLLQMLNYEFASQQAIDSTNPVFPSLEIIRRAGPPQHLAEEIFAAVSNHLGSNSSSVRDSAARVVAIFLICKVYWLQDAIRLMQTCEHLPNRLHGVILSIHHVLEIKSIVEGDFPLKDVYGFGYALVALRTSLQGFGASSYIKAQCEDIITFLTFQTWEMEQIELQALKPSSTFQDIFLSDNIAQNTRDMLLAYETRNQRSLNMPFVSKPDEEFALRRATTTRAIVSSVASGFHHQAIELLTMAAMKDGQIFTAILEDLGSTLNFIRLEHSDFLTGILMVFEDARQHLEINAYHEISEWYLTVLRVSSDADVQQGAMWALASVLDKLFQDDITLRPTVLDFLFEYMSFPSFVETEGTLCARLRLQGSYLPFEVVIAQEYDATEEKEFSQRLMLWGIDLRWATKELENFDYRDAAVESLQAFYKKGFGPKMFSWTWYTDLLDSMVALFDFLQDDEENIRIKAETTVCHILDVPSTTYHPDYDKKLLLRIQHSMKDHLPFRQEVTHRLTSGDSLGQYQYSWGSTVSDRLFKAIRSGDATLFVEEEQNLFKDELKVAELWGHILTTGEGPSWNETAKEVSVWCIDGLGTLLRFAQFEDKPLGWSAQPRAFAICMRILIASNAFLGRYQTWAPFSYLGELDAENPDPLMRDCLSQVVKIAQFLIEIVNTGRNNSLHGRLLDEATRQLWVGDYWRDTVKSFPKSDPATEACTDSKSQ